MSQDASFSDIPWVIESKFEPNRPRLDLVRRDRLLAQMHEGVNKKLVLVVAPAGYGKSSLLGQWAAEAVDRDIPFGWLTLESGEADEKQFLAYVVLVLSRAGLKLDELVTGARDGFADAAIDGVLSKLIRLINEAPGQMILILEDYHSAECDAVNAIVKRLIRDTLSKFTIFIDSRRQPNIDAFSLIASGDAIEIAAPQLRLTKEETVKALGDIADETSGQNIYEQTEGWPVAVQLALVQKRAQPSEPILTGVDGGLVASYLTEQILSTLTPDTQELLLAVAFLERFNPELTNYVLDSPDAWSRIDSLSSFAALIVPLGASGGGYRLHHLFAEYLRDMQARRSQEWAKKILSRASQWYAEKRQLVEAVRYAAKAEDYEECERLILAAGGWKVILNDGIGVLRNALRLLPEDVIAASARLMIARSYLHCKNGEIPEARAMLDASTWVEQVADPKMRDLDRLVIETMINLYEDRLDWTEDYTRLRSQYSSDEDLDALGQGTMRCDDILIHLMRGDFEGASAHLRAAFSLMRQSGSVLGLNYCYIHAAHIALYRGDFATAAANIDRASKMADENFGSDSGLKAVATVIDYSLRVWKGECAAQDLEPFRDILFHIIDNDGWADVYMTGVNAIILLARQCDEEKIAAEVFQKINLFADQRRLKRLGLFTSLLEYSVESAMPATPQPAMPKAEISQFVEGYQFEDAPYNWQSFALAACLIASTETAGKATPTLEAATALADRCGSGFWVIRLRLGHVFCALNAGELDAAKEALSALLHDAQPLGMTGLFLGDDRIIRLLNTLRSDLRHDEDALITLQFVDQILETAKALKPAKETGFLSEREHEVLQKLANGMSNKEIARALELTENTVKFHLKSLFSKLSVSKRTQAVVEAQRQGLID